ncbi:M1 family metallopeptidase [Chitinophaga filiformis]|uniref:M1 family metallopeptidase n=1 Tax=Chitinophaga filiformis TaxID=104663 RepID=UPI001F31F57D|nr:M1 family metallopeptidase [Chitinophaga filiformis]MCF6404604.1 M1 family metallopeptidase [Chitinophaga filiformis]
MIKYVLLTLLISLYAMPANGQAISGSSRETMPADVAQEYRWWNLLKYTIEVTPDYRKKFISGNNNISFEVLNAGKVMRISLQEPMTITAVTWKKKQLSFEKKGNDTYLITFPQELIVGDKQTISVAFSGHPQEAIRPPFGSGWIWTKDGKGRPWMSIACEGAGASIWLPCKEVLYDEPDNGASVSITVPDTLVAIANGRLQQKTIGRKGTVTYTWTVTSPINNYNIIPSIGKYVGWHRQYNGLKGPLDCDYWVLDYNRKKAEAHFLQADTMLHAFEYWLGPYPFYQDSYKLVEAPMPGMEHQSAVAYGNGFRNGYEGTDRISGTGWGLKWDFILIHESGHEWFGNSITSGGFGESWIHEGFTKYLETLYTDFVFGNAAGNEYAIGTWKRIKNDEAIIGTNTSDKYYKGSAMLHTIRQIVGDSTFRGWLLLLNKELYHQTVSTDQVLTLLNQYSGRNFSKVFAQYLTTTQIPTLEYSFHENELSYRWTNCMQGFDMPLKILFENRIPMLITPTTEWQRIPLLERDIRSLSADKNYCVRVKQL